MDFGYVRVSSADQNPARQYAALRAGSKLDRTFEDKASGKSTDRPELAAMLGCLREGDTVHVASMDRLARSLPDLLSLVAEMTSKGVTVEFVSPALTFAGSDDDPMSTLLLSLLGAVAQFERSLIRERQAAGIAAAKARGEYAGRGGRPRALSDEQVSEARQRVDQGESRAQIAKALGVSRSSLLRALNAEGVYAASASAV